MKLVAAPDVLFRKFGNEAVLLHLASERYFSLNDSALLIYEMLTQGKDVDEVAAAVADEYEVEPAVVEGDVRELMTELRSLDLIMVDEGT